MYHVMRLSCARYEVLLVMTHIIVFEGYERYVIW
jgi:hypothetical protein